MVAWDPALRNPELREFLGVHCCTGDGRWKWLALWPTEVLRGRSQRATFNWTKTNSWLSPAVKTHSFEKCDPGYIPLSKESHVFYAEGVSLYSSVLRCMRRLELSTRCGSTAWDALDVRFSCLLCGVACQEGDELLINYFGFIATLQIFYPCCICLRRVCVL
jgi:hypothetical protein